MGKQPSTPAPSVDAPRAGSYAERMADAVMEAIEKNGRIVKSDLVQALEPFAFKWDLTPETREAGMIMVHGKQRSIAEFVPSLSEPWDGWYIRKSNVGDDLSGAWAAADLTKPDTEVTRDMVANAIRALEENDKRHLLEGEFLDDPWDDTWEDT